MDTVNRAGLFFWEYFASMFVQAAILITFLLLFDLLVKNRVRAVVRYAFWMLVPVKLALPPFLTSPIGVGNWLGLLQSADAQQGSSAAIPEYWHGVLLLVWAAGVCIFAALLIQRLFFVRALIAQSKLVDEEWFQLLATCKEEVGVQRLVRLRLSTNMVSPVICGFRTPTILLPHDLVAKFDKEQIRAVLIHELCHLKQHDLGVSMIQTVLQVIYFYHPLVWVANARIRQVRELAVDERALAVMRGQPERYCGMLLDIAEMAFSRPALGLRFIGVVESKHRLAQRIKQIAERPLPTSSKVGVPAVIAIILFGCFLLPMRTLSTNTENLSGNTENEWGQESWDDAQDGGSPDTSGTWDNQPENGSASDWSNSPDDEP